MHMPMYILYLPCLAIAKGLLWVYVEEVQFVTFRSGAE